MKYAATYLHDKYDIHAYRVTYIVIHSKLLSQLIGDGLHLVWCLFLAHRFV